MFRQYDPGQKRRNSEDWEMRCVFMSPHPFLLEFNGTVKPPVGISGAGMDQPPCQAGFEGVVKEKGCVRKGRNPFMF